MTTEVSSSRVHPARRPHPLPLVHPDSIPASLKAIGQWIGYSLVPKENGKTDKIPKNPHTGGNARVDAPNTYTDFDTALTFAEATDGIDGVAFVLTDNDGIVGIDLDNCVNDDIIQPAAQTIIQELDSYTEISPSGTGIRIFVTGSLPPGRRRDTVQAIEMYETGRFLTVTGQHVMGTPHTVEPRSEEVTALHDRIFARDHDVATIPTLSCPPAPPFDDDAALWERMFASRQGDKLRRLFDGDISVSRNDASFAVIELGNALAWWTDKDPARMERMIRQTHLLARDKWDQPRGEITWLQYQIQDCIIFVSGSLSDTASAESVPALTAPGTTDPEPESTNDNNARDDTPPTPHYPLMALPDGRPLTPDMRSYFLHEGVDDEGNAQCVNRLHGNRYLYCPSYGWLEWTDTHWNSSQVSEAHLNISITETLKLRRMVAVQAEQEHIVKETRQTASRKRAVKEQLQDRLIVDVKEFDVEPHLLNCKNGVVDLRNGKIVAHEASNRFTYCVNADYVPSRDTSPWDQYLASVVGDYDNIAEWLQMAVGYSISGYTNEEILFYLHGPTRSGKGTFTTALLNCWASPWPVASISIPLPIAVTGMPRTLTWPRSSPAGSLRPQNPMCTSASMKRL